METIQPKPAFNNGSHKSKLARTFQRVVNLRTATKIASSNGIGNGSHDGSDVNRRVAALETLVAMVFAGVTSIKAAYAELQLAQHPYNSDAFQAADEAIVEQLKVLSELKHKFLKQELEVSPQVTLMLAEIQEQQSLMRTYEIRIKRLESDIERKFREVDDEGDGDSKMGCYAAAKTSSLFAIAKYLKLVHPRMECSFFGNLNQREVVINGGFPETAFFTAYAEMGWRFWLLCCLGFSMSGQVSVFQVKRDCRFSDVYMENVSEESLFCDKNISSNEIFGFRVCFTVVPGFKIVIFHVTETDQAEREVVRQIRSVSSGNSLWTQCPRG
ncbi:putative alpha,alpha-trehalose-phosphate synthase 7-like [Hibiscus syriacus]|uniref:Alpha,alpha-trehalose-phosphate synthase 7-like n=1 Tax=Hibiscus syriacus TaxID=106335 RepID=A0A6A2YGK4_HIBSY|nr:putative alpha,alpha-trehalose-phosphate synthase 7-like [Hibiscus syriacus]